jgi:translation initiation factor 3 subunit A
MGSRFHRGATFQKPENALKRAEELVVVGQRGAALQTLHDVITSKRHRTWHKVLEQIMFRYIDLCVELKKGRYAKDGLIHFRNICQQVNVSSLEEVIKHFLKTATDKAEAAQSKAAEVSTRSILLLHPTSSVVPGNTAHADHLLFRAVAVSNETAKV